MKLEFVVLCDFAQDMGGKLTLVGSFDAIHAEKLPIRMPNMGIGIKMRYEKADQTIKRHKFELRIKTPTGQVIQQMAGEAEHAFPSEMTIEEREMQSLQLAINMQGTTFTTFGKHTFEWWLDNRLMHQAPIYILPKQQVSQKTLGEPK